MKLNNFINGLRTLQPYYEKDGYSIGAEHDEFFAYATDYPLDSDDVQKMVDFGWTQPESRYWDDDDDFKAKHYDPTEGWRALV